MTPATRLLVVLSVLVVAGAGAAAFVLTSKPAAPPPAPAAAVPGAGSPPAAPQPLPAPSAQAPAPAAADGPTVQFSASIENYSLIRDSAAYSAASPTAPQFYPLVAGTGVVSAARSTDGNWVIAMTQDGQAAFIPSADLGPYDPSKVPMLQSISGPAQVIDTATLSVNGQQIKLWGVVGQTGDYATGLQSFIDSKGSSVDCTLKGTAYVCTLPGIGDIARSSLFNGAASVSPDASDDYKQQQVTAQSRHLGMWK